MICWRCCRRAAMVVFCSMALADGLSADDPASLPVISGDYPRAYFFRQSESFAALPKISYDEWDACFSRLMGIEGKVLDEEVPGRSLRNIDFFTRFKRRHPEQLVMLHYNGDARDPRDHIGKFFAGHWLYHNGAKILRDVPAESGQCEIKVDQPQLFRTSVGRFRNANEDLGLCELDAAGKPDWSRSEQVELLAVDRHAKTIRVRRGCYGTAPRALVAGRSYAAAHVYEGPWGGKNFHLLWLYNYSTRCPRDAQGHTCADVLCEELAAHFAPGGDLEALDGLEFDVLYHEPHGGPRMRGPDADADGHPDGGNIDGLNTYGLGVIDFCRQLRGRMGPKRLILADGMDPENQRAFGILNGMESEGWPDLKDWEMHDWSGGMNRHNYWNLHALPPVFNYVNHKFTLPPDVSGRLRQPDVPFSVHRLVFAAAMFTDAAICYAFAPPKPAQELCGIWDELQKGTEHQLGWLGKPLRPAVRMALRGNEMLSLGRPAELLARLRGDGLSFTVEGDRVKIAATDPHATALQFHLAGVPCEGPDLLVKMTMQGEPLPGYPPEMPRLAWVGLPGPRDPPPRAKLERFMTWVGKSPFDSSSYFSAMAAKTTDLEWNVEGGQAVWLAGLRAYHAPDAMYREFEHGVVLGNPSPRPYTFELARLLPGQKFRRLRGSPEQDPKANDGSPAIGPVVLGPKEGLFLVRE